MALVPVSQWFVHLLEFLELLFGNLIIVKDLDIVFRDGLDFTLLILAKVLGCELINWVIKDEDLISLLDILGKNWTALN